jgi:4-amino-4-deoxy-L-arabinose transferase-like glycosyltransferase
MTTQVQEQGFETSGEIHPVAAPLGASRLAHYAALTLILVLHVGGSLYWVGQNQVLVGHDASEYLETSIQYTSFFNPLSWQSLFRAFVFTDYRTPAIYIAAQPFYALFGVDMDSAQLLNILLFAFVLLLTYALGRQLAGEGVGLFAALLVGLLPLMAAMARLFYTEMFLTAMVVLNLLALYRSQRFASSTWSLLWGISLGVGLLVKWTMPIYLWLPLLWYGWQAGLLQDQVEAMRHARFRVRTALLAIAIAALLSTVWFWPNRAEVQLFPLGNFLWLGWFFALAFYGYAQLQPSSPVSNLWAALLLALVIASFWYLPHINFGARLLEVDAERSQVNLSPWLSDDLWRYLRYIYQDHFGRLAFWVVAPLALLPWLVTRLQGRSLNPSTHLLWLSIAGAFLVLIVLGQDNPRNLTPLLPAFAILATISLSAYPRPFPVLIGAGWLIVLLVQWGIFTWDGALPFYQRTRPLWADSDYAKPPSAGETDPGYWVGPRILDAITIDQDLTQSFGVLVNTHQVHRGIFRYLIAIDQRPVRIRALTTEQNGNWANLLASQWVLTNDGDNQNVTAPGLALLARIEAGDPLFAALYAATDRIHLPNGDTLTLYHRKEGPGWPEAAPDQMASAQTVAEAVTAAWSRHAQLLYATPDLAVWVGMHDPAPGRIRVLNAGESIALADLPNGPITWLLVTDAKSQRLESLFDATYYRAGAIGDDFAALVIYGATHHPLTNVAVSASWGAVRLSALHSHPTIEPGQVLPVEIAMNGEIASELKISARLITADGAVIASHDFPLTTDNRFGLFVPPQTPPGRYHLALVVYEGLSLAVIPDQRGATPTLLTTIRISP